MSGLQAAKQYIKKLPLLGPIAVHIYRLMNVGGRFDGSKSYWESRYKEGGNSGNGSYRALAEFKAEVLNRFVAEKGLQSVIEYGCGDGNQLKLAEYPAYIGFDVSATAISLCKDIFHGDKSKFFRLLEEYKGEKADLVLSLDVIYHLVEDNVFDAYMAQLFESANSWVIIYSSNTDDNSSNGALHVKHRRFMTWVEKNKPEWRLHELIKNRYPDTGNNEISSFADFFILTRS